jgi:NAD-dependent deacetylase
VLLVVGTSAVVYPAAGLIGTAAAAGAKIIIVNTEPSNASDLADVEILGPAGEILPQIL